MEYENDWFIVLFSLSEWIMFSSIYPILACASYSALQCVSWYNTSMMPYEQRNFGTQSTCMASLQCEFLNDLSKDVFGKMLCHIVHICMASLQCEFLHVLLNDWFVQIFCHIGCICMASLQCEILNDFSNEIYGRILCCTVHICMLFLQCVQYNVPSNIL